MTQRSYKMFACGYNEFGTTTHVTLHFNGVKVFEGDIPTKEEPTPWVDVTPATEATITWQADLELTGTIPVTMTIANGDMVMNRIEANYCGAEVEPPTDLETPGWVIIKHPEDVWQDPNENTPESDGRTNVLVNGLPYHGGPNPGGGNGDGGRVFPAGSTVTFDFFVDPALVFHIPPDLDWAAYFAAQQDNQDINSDLERQPAGEEAPPPA